METDKLKRRKFLQSALGATMLAACGGIRALASTSSQNDAKLARLACNSWPFRAYFDTPEMHEYRESKYPLLSQTEFPQFLADHFNIHNVELLPQHFADTDPATIDRIKRGLEKSRSRCCNLMGLEIPGGVYAADSDAKKIMREAERWTNIAVALGSPSITVALSGPGSVDAATAARNLSPFVAVARKRGVKVLFHNDSLETESAETLTAVIHQLGRPQTGACPDFGNFATKSSAFALEQLKMLAPYASNLCHAKDGIADKGRFYADDFPASMKTMRDAGFRGLYSLEFEGLDTPLEGVHKLMERTLEQLS